METRLTKYTWKQDYIYHPGNDVLELYNGLAQVRFAASKTNLISSVTNLVYDLPHYSKLRKLENVWKISNLGGDMTYCLVPLPDIKLWR